MSIVIKKYSMNESYTVFYRFAMTLFKLDKRLKPKPGPEWYAGVGRIFWKWGVYHENE
jgi:hypothetical protein